MTKRLLADVLWRAANERLWDGRGDYSHREYVWRFSCDAVGCDGVTLMERRSAFNLLQELGCCTGSLDLFSEFADGKKRQGVRYMWLLLAMHVAEDEGIDSRQNRLQPSMYVR